MKLNKTVKKINKKLWFSWYSPPHLWFAVQNGSKISGQLGMGINMHFAAVFGWSFKIKKFINENIFIKDNK